jgi:23S rRNA (uracil1939-C5)-methyltransferase
VIVRVINRVAPSSSRLFCRHMDACGGCSLPHAFYADQLDVKASRLNALFARVAAATRTALPTARFVDLFRIDAEPRHFRQKVAFTFASGSSDSGLIMGHFARGSQRVVAVTECPVHSTRGNQIAFALRDRLAQARIRAADVSLGLVRHVLIRATADDREAVAMLIVTRNDRALRAPIRALLASPDRPDGFFINISADDSPFMIGPTTLRINGRSHIRERVGGYAFLVSPTTFFQTNVAAASVLQRLVVEGAGPAARVLDLYCGSGLFTLPLARIATVIGVEDNRQAIKDADANVRLNRLDRGRVRFIAARVEEALVRLGRERWDAVVLDPPRQGCPPVVLNRVFKEIAPGRAVYVSCNPEALAAELPAIISTGYAVTGLHAVDMFPHTDHIELVALLERR